MSFHFGAIDSSIYSIRRDVSFFKPSELMDTAWRELKACSLIGGKHYEFSFVLKGDSEKFRQAHDKLCFDGTPKYRYRKDGSIEVFFTTKFLDLLPVRIFGRLLNRIVSQSKSKVLNFSVYSPMFVDFKISEFETLG